MQATFDDEGRKLLGDNWLMRLYPSNDGERALFSGFHAGSRGDSVKLYGAVRVEPNPGVLGPGGELALDIYFLIPEEEDF